MVYHAPGLCDTSLERLDGFARGESLRHLFQAVPAQQGPDDAALDHQDGDWGDQVGAQHHAPVGVVMRQQDGEVKGVRASSEALGFRKTPCRAASSSWDMNLASSRFIPANASLKP